VNNKREKIRVKDDILHNNLVHGEYLTNIKIGDLLTGTKNFKSIEDVILIVRYEMQGQHYERLKTCVLDILKLNKKFMNTDSTLELTSFLKRFKKGSKQFRKIFDCFADSQLKKNRRTITFSNLVELPVPESNTLTALQSLWTCNVYPMRLRDFIFKFRNNLFGLNTRVLHFNNNVSRHCTFCWIASQNDPNSPDETFLHLFFSCPHTKRVIKSFLKNLPAGTRMTTS
jgi:hypothetical protein